MIINRLNSGVCAEKNILSACAKIAKAVGSTHGPGGRPVIIDTPTTYPQATKDGVSVARNLYYLEDTWERIAGQMLINAANKQLADTGDGTTAVLVLANELIQRGRKAINRGVNPIQLKEGLDVACREITEELRLLSRELNSPSMVLNVATIASNSDKEIGGLIADAITRVGENGIVDHVLSQDRHHSVDFTTGYEWPKGPQSHLFFNIPGRMEAVFDEPQILVTDLPMTRISELEPLVKRIKEDSEKRETFRPLVIIGEADPHGEVLPILAHNAASGRVHSMIVPMDGRDDEKDYHLQDIAALTGATFITRHKAMRLQDTRVWDLGTCERIKSTPRSTSIIFNQLTEDQRTRKDALAKELHDIVGEDKETASVAILVEYAKKRLARVTGGVARIRVGGKTESEQAEIAARVDDAIRATRSAQEEGVVPGGGMAYILAKNELHMENTLDLLGASKSMKIGYELLVQSLDVLFDNILKNAGINPRTAKWGVYTNAGSYPGYDAYRKETVGDMFDVGIIDPTKVVRSALENAVSVAGLLMLSGTMISTEKSEAAQLQELKS